MDTLVQIATQVGGWIILVLVLWLGIRFFEWKQLFYPVRRITETPEDWNIAYEDIDFVAEDGVRLHGWWIPREGARGTLLYCHGNAGNISDRAWLADEFHKLHVNAFIFDYRGYGKSKGFPTEKGTYRDARAAFEVVRAKYNNADNPPVIVYGKSLGGAVAIQLANDKPAMALAVESPLASTTEMARRIYPFLPTQLICRFKYDSLSKVQDLKIPKVIAHSPQDEMLPYEFSSRLFRNAAEPKEFVELSGGHNDSGWVVSPEYRRALEQLCTRVFGPPDSM